MNRTKRILLAVSLTGLAAIAAVPAFANPDTDCSSLPKWVAGPTGLNKKVWAPDSSHDGAEFKSKHGGYSTKAPADDPDWWEKVAECKGGTKPK